MEKKKYGIDTMRAWVASKDTDCNISMDLAEIDNVNEEVKLFRGLILTLMNDVQ